MSSTARLFNILTGLVLVATVCLLAFYTLVGLNVYNPFPPPTLVPVAQLPTGTPTPDAPTAVPTWTPTPTPTVTPTPEATNTPRPTLTPSPFPTFPPTATPPPTVTPTPRVTRAPWPFTCEVEYRNPLLTYGHAWTGVAGHVQDLDGNPLPGYYAQVKGPVNGTVRAGVDPRINAIYTNDAAWEQSQNPSAYQAMEVRVQLFNDQPEPDGSYRAVSDVVVVELGGFASGSLGYVTCTLNWQEWLPATETPTPTIPPAAN